MRSTFHERVTDWSELASRAKRTQSHKQEQKSVCCTYLQDSYESQRAYQYEENKYLDKLVRFEK